MTIYTVMQCDYDNDIIIGSFSSLEKAQEFITYRQYFDEEWDYTYRIKETKIDGWSAEQKIRYVIQVESLVDVYEYYDLEVKVYKPCFAETKLELLENFMMMKVDLGELTFEELKNVDRRSYIELFDTLMTTLQETKDEEVVTELFQKLIGGATNGYN